MRTISAQSILNGVMRREGGSNITEGNATDAEVAQFFDYIADRLRTAWEFHPWLETFVVEQRFFRAEWLVGTIYAGGAEVRFTDSTGALGYYVASAVDVPAAGESPESAPGKWAVLTSFRRLVEFEQVGATAFEACVAAYDAEPDAEAGARQLSYSLAGDGVVMSPDYTGSSVWLKLVKRCEDFAAVRWVVGTAYEAGRVIYFATTGEVYEVVVTTTAGDTPITEPAKFRRLDFPYILGRAVKSGALADWMRADGKTEAASNEESQFYRALDEQKWRLVAQQGQRGRIAFLSTR